MKPKRLKNVPNRLQSKDAFSLVEVMVAAVILSLIGFGTLSGMLQARRMTQGSINEGTAMTVAQGYLEQMKNMQFSLLDGSEITELINQGAADTLKVSPTVSNPEVGGGSDISNVKSLDINNTPNDPGDDLVIDFVLYIENLTDLASEVGEARRIVIRYSYSDNSQRGRRSVTNTLVTVRSDVPTF